MWHPRKGPRPRSPRALTASEDRPAQAARGRSDPRSLASPGTHFDAYDVLGATRSPLGRENGPPGAGRAPAAGWADALCAAGAADGARRTPPPPIVISGALYTASFLPDDKDSPHSGPFTSKALPCPLLGNTRIEWIGAALAALKGADGASETSPVRASEGGDEYTFARIISSSCGCAHRERGPRDSQPVRSSPRVFSERTD